jgi:maltodextrin utilization protein YvdJ
MSKNKKKRNKKYTGIDARNNDNSVTIHQVSAVNRSPAHQWLFEHKKIIRVVIIAVLVIALIVAGIISLFSH